MIDQTQDPRLTANIPLAAKPKPARATRPVQLRKLLKRKNGATIAQLQNSFGWQPHTARAAISSLRTAGETVERNDAPKGAIYRIVSTGVAS